MSNGRAYLDEGEKEKEEKEEVVVKEEEVVLKRQMALCRTDKTEAGKRVGGQENCTFHYLRGPASKQYHHLLLLLERLLCRLSGFLERLFSVCLS